MDLRSLIEKLDTIEQRKLLQESEQLMEKVRIRYSDVEAVANQYKDDEAGRLAAYTKLIKDNNLPGLFDPIKKELVKPDGSYAWFAGANEETVKRLEQWGLLPDEAKTSSWLGMRGEDEKTAMPANKEARSRDAMVDRAEELMKKAGAFTYTPSKPTTAEPGKPTPSNAAVNTTQGPNMGKVNIDPNAKCKTCGTAYKDHFDFDANGKITYTKVRHPTMKGDFPGMDGMDPSKFAQKESAFSIANSLMEEFGLIKKSLLETITPDEHNELKKLITNLTPFAKTDPDAADIVAQFKAYNEKRDALIARIKELINTLKSKTTTPAKPTVKESLNESKQRMIAEGRVQVLEEGKLYLRDGIEWTFNPETRMFSHINESGETIELDEEGFWQGVGDTGRGFASGLTLGYADNIAAGVSSMFKGTKYADELKKNLATTAKVKERSPWLYGAGALAGFVANPLAKFGYGLPLLGAELASDKFIREPHNANMMKQAGQNGSNVHGSPTLPQGTNLAIAQMQKELKAAGADLGPTGPNKDGIDGKIGKYTTAAMQKFPDIAKKYNMSPQAGGQQQTADTTQQQNVAAIAQALGLPANADAKTVAEKLKTLGNADAIMKAIGGTVSESNDELVSLRSLSGISESKLEENAILRAGLEWLLKGGADAAVKGGAEGILKAGGEEVAKIGQAFVDGQGTTWAKRAGYWEPVSGPLKGAKNQVGLKSNPNMFAKLEAEFAAKNGVSAGAEVAAKGAESVVEKEIATTFGGKATSAIERIKGYGGKFVSFLKNHKFLTAIALLAIIGYTISQDGSVVADSGGDSSDVHPSPTAPSASDAESPEMEELRKLLAQLNGGWPTDAETAEVNKLAEELGIKPETAAPTTPAAGREGSSASPSPTAASNTQYQRPTAGMSQQQIRDLTLKNIGQEVGRQ